MTFCEKRSILKESDEKELFKKHKLPKGWYWNFVFAPDSLPKQNDWSLSAFRRTGRSDIKTIGGLSSEGGGRSYPVNEVDEVYASGKDLGIVLEKIRDVIKNKEWATRFVYEGED